MITQERQRQAAAVGVYLDGLAISIEATSWGFYATKTINGRKARLPTALAPDLPPGFVLDVAMAVDEAFRAFTWADQRPWLK